MHKIGLKLGSKDTQYTEEIIELYKNNLFQYIELFAISDTFDQNIEYWKQFKIPFVIHAPHSMAGLNLADQNERKNNTNKIKEVTQFADELRAKYIIFHSGINGSIKETIFQLKPFADSRFLIENKPYKGLNDEKCVGSTLEELNIVIKELNIGFCLDFGHGICAANTLKVNPVEYITKLMELTPKMFHLTDGDYFSAYDSHMHYGQGSFPLKVLLQFVPTECMITNEAKRDNKTNLIEIINDTNYLRNL